MEFTAFLLFRRKESFSELLCFRKSLHFIYAGRSHVKKLKAKISVSLFILAVFSNGENLVSRQIVKGLSAATWPFDLDEFDLTGLSQSKVEAKVTLREIAASASNFLPAAPALGGQFHSCTHSR
jgi:hypothetical protein